MAADAPDVVVVARKAGNAKVLVNALGEKGYSGAPATDDKTLAAYLDARPPPGLALVDVSGFGREVWRWCETLQLRGIPFVVISAPDLDDVEVASTRIGARSVLKKPIRKAAILAIAEDIIASQGPNESEDIP